MNSESEVRFPEEDEESRILPLPLRISYAAKIILGERLSRPVDILESFVYHTSIYGSTIRTKTFLITESHLYSVKASFDKNTNEMKWIDINIEIPRGRRDFDIEIVLNAKGKKFLIPYLGEMKLPGILVERDDIFPPEEMAEKIKELVTSGKEKIDESATEQLALSNEEIELIEKYVRIMRFEKMLREAIMASLKDVYGKNVQNRVCTALGGELDKITKQIEGVSKRFGRECPPIELPILFQNFGFEHYVILAKDEKIWEKTLVSIFADRDQLVEGLRVIRDIRNEIAHFRPTIHPKLWDAASLYMEIIEGKVRMTDPAFKRIVSMIPGK